MEKKSLRALFREKVSLLPFDERQTQSQQIGLKILSFLEKAQEGYWSLYWPLSDEPDLSSCFEKKPSHIQWVLPKVQASGELSFYHIQDSKDLKPNAWGLMQPDTQQCALVSKQDINGFIIPALAYDSNGVRLGRGGGYYDQTLKDCAGQKIGVIFENSFSQDPLPKETHDQSVDFVVTANTWIQVRGL